MQANHNPESPIEINDTNPYHRVSSVRGVPGPMRVRSNRPNPSNRTGLSSLFPCRVRSRPELAPSSSPTRMRFTSRSRQTIPSQSNQSSSPVTKLNLNIDIDSERGLKSMTDQPLNEQALTLDTAATFEARAKVLVDENVRLRAQIDDLMKLTIDQTSVTPTVDPDSSMCEKTPQKDSDRNGRFQGNYFLSTSVPSCSQGNDSEGQNDVITQLRTRLAEVSKENERLCKMMGDLRIRGVDRMRQLEEERDELEERLSSSRDTCQALEASLMQLRDWSMRCLRRKDEAADYLRRENFSSQTEIERLNRLIIDLRTRLSERNHYHRLEPASADYQDNIGCSSNLPVSKIAIGSSMEGNVTSESEDQTFPRTSCNEQKTGSINPTELENGYADKSLTESLLNDFVGDDCKISQGVHNAEISCQDEQILEASNKEVYPSTSGPTSKGVEENGDDTRIDPAVTVPKRYSLDSILPNNRSKITPLREDSRIKIVSKQKNMNVSEDRDCIGNNDAKIQSLNLDRGRIFATSSSVGSSGTTDISKESEDTARNMSEPDKMTRTRSFSAHSHKSSGRDASGSRRKCERRSGAKDLTGKLNTDTIVRFQIDEKIPRNNASTVNDNIILKTSSHDRTNLKSRTWMGEKIIPRSNSEPKLESPRRLYAGSEKLAEATCTASIASLGKHGGEGDCERQKVHTDAMDLKNPLMCIRREQIIVGQFCQHAIDIVRKLLGGQAGAVEKEDELKELIEVEWEKWMARLQTKEELVNTVEGWVRNCSVVDGFQYDVVNSFNTWYGKQYSIYRERAAAGAASIATGVAAVQVVQRGANNKNASPVPKVLPPPHDESTKDEPASTDEPVSGAFEDASAANDEKNGSNRTSHEEPL